MVRRLNYPRPLHRGLTCPPLSRNVRDPEPAYATKRPLQPVRLGANVMHFARLLRRAGLPVGPAETIAAQDALTRIDLASKTQARTALRTAMIHRHEHQDVFDQAFALFWRDPSAAEQAAAMALLDAQKDKKPERAPPASRRVAEAFARRRTARRSRRTNRRSPT